MRKLRRRIESWNWPVELIGRAVVLWLRLCLRTARWSHSGFEELEAALEKGPVLVVSWHSRTNLLPAQLQRLGHPFTAIRDPSPAGRVGGVIQRQFGMTPIPLRKGKASAASMREILKAAKAGRSIAIAADGPNGPARVAKPAALDWAKASGLPVFVMANITTRHWRFSSWDKMYLPRLFGRGHMGFAHWKDNIPRKLNATDTEALCEDLGRALDAVQAQVDRAVGLEPGP